MLDAILSLDIGTSSTRALLWDTQGNLVKPYEAQIKYALHTTPDGGAEIPAEDASAYRLLHRQPVTPSRGAGVHYSCRRNLYFLALNGRYR